MRRHSTMARLKMKSPKVEGSGILPGSNTPTFSDQISGDCFPEAESVTWHLEVIRAQTKSRTVALALVHSTLALPRAAIVTATVFATTRTVLLSTRHFQNPPVRLAAMVTRTR